MVDTDWREILSFSQRELKQADKEKLCENLSWMEADDIELNFTDLKTLFRLAQDILKFKSEQVNNLLGQLETSQRKGGKRKGKDVDIDSPKSTDTALETLAHQEEVIKSNKEILQQLYTEIAELEGRKSKLEEDGSTDKDSESSRDVLSEIEAVAQLEKELSLKNRHIRKMLGDVKVLEEENTELKEKIAMLKEKLTEATQLIENMTEQLRSLNNENTKFKEILGNTEKAKLQLVREVESLRKEMFNKEFNKENIYEEIKTKVQHWKNVVRSKKAEIDELTDQNSKLKEDLARVSQSTSSPKVAKKNKVEQLKIKELQEKLLEASNDIINSANLIKQLKTENKQLKNITEEIQDVSLSDGKNESDEGKERIIINKLKSKNKSLATALKGAEEMIAVREQELTEITAQLQLLKTEEGIEALLEGLKNKKRQLKYKDEGIKTLVKEINTLHQTVDDLQLENESMRQKLNIPSDYKVPTQGIIKQHRDLEHQNKQLIKQLRKLENKLVNSELENQNLRTRVTKLNTMLARTGYKDEDYQEHGDEDNDVMPQDGGGESSVVLLRSAKRNFEEKLKQETFQKQMDEIAEENEGLRKGLQEILDFLKDNRTTTSGVLSLECPSLEAMLQSMEARHSAGWFAPHMSAIMALRAALGGKDALLTALHEARKETFEVMTQLSKESQKAQELEQKLQEAETKTIDSKAPEPDIPNLTSLNMGEFGSWISDKDQTNVDVHNTQEIESLTAKGNLIYEDRLKNGLIYFHHKFKALFDKMTSIAIQAMDDKNKWSLQEEQYKAQIENLKSESGQVADDDETSDISPGIVNIPSISSLQRKCSYLEESYKYIRTLNENMKNEYLEAKRESLIAASEYENLIQKLILSVSNLTDKLRSSISLELFWKQHESLSDVNTKYRKALDENLKTVDESTEFYKRLENDKSEIISSFQVQIDQLRHTPGEESKIKTIMSNIEQSIFTKQLQQICLELEEKTKKIKLLEISYTELEETQGKLIDKTLSSVTKEHVDLMKEQLEKLVDENKILKEQCHHVGSQLDIALLQLQDSQQRQMSNDLEINMLRHQILDLQSTGDNKAIVARLSGEVLVAHLQASESNKKIERLNSALIKEKELRVEAEEMLNARQKIFDVYASRYESKFRYMYDVMDVLRQQYQGSLPRASIENYLNNIEDIHRKSLDVNEKLDEIEELRSSLMIKHSVFNQILDVSKNKCLEDVDSCSHKLQNLVLEGTHTRELEHFNQKLKTLELSRQQSIKRCNFLERTLLHINQGFDKSTIDIMERRNSVDENKVPNLELEDIQSDDDSDSTSLGARTVTLTKPQILKPSKNNIDMTSFRKEDATTMLQEPTTHYQPKFHEAIVQTSSIQTELVNNSTQTDDHNEILDLNKHIITLRTELAKKSTEITEAMNIVHQRTEQVSYLNDEKYKLEAKVQNYMESQKHRDVSFERMQATIEHLKSQLEVYKSASTSEKEKSQQIQDKGNRSLINALKELERDKNTIVGEYKGLLNNEREQFSKSVMDMQAKITELQEELDRYQNDTSNSPSEAVKDVISKYSVKIVALEDKCFKAESELDGYKTELMNYKSEVDRWKSLASERLIKMEQLNSRLEERHCHEVESYKAENEHWIAKLSDTQKEHMELRTKITEQKASFMKQLSEKEAQIEQLRTVNSNLKTQIMNMQTMLSISDPSFDLSAIVEVDEGSDAISQQGSDRLEIKFDSSVDLRELQDDMGRFPSSSSGVWQEPIIERLRKEKQFTSKQNAILRRQIKALAGRERRARLDAQNLKNQVFRISTSGNKVVTAETASMQNRIATLQAQLMSARRDTHSSVALWDKWKRAQQAAERWQSRYEEKCQEVRKMEASVTLSKSAVTRLEKEKRLLLSRLNEMKHENISIIVEKQDGEESEKARSSEYYTERESPSARALLDRVEAQQRRIAALEVAERGNEHLVSEYEKAMAEMTSLKGQVLKLESALLESQIKTPIKSARDSESELDYFKSYCEMLKEENVQLNLKISSLEATPSSSTTSQARINDLEQTILTLRGLVSRLQSEQKLTNVYKRPDSRPNSGRSATEKSRSQLESYRLEIANLKRSIHDKDLLLERSKEMLKIAAEREDDLLRENTLLRRQLNDLTKSRGGFLSA